MTPRLSFIASYPRSGNTWTRIILAKLRWGLELSINGADGSLHGVLGRIFFDKISPVKASNLFPHEIDNFLPDIYRRVNAEAEGRLIVKVHNSARRNQLDDLLYPPECAAGVIYLVRHPFDVAVSCAHHFGIEVRTAVDFMANGNVLRAAYTRLPETIPEYFDSWSNNICSWIDNPAYRATLARYEDILAQPDIHFLRLAHAAGLNPASHELALAIHASRFESLQKEEAEKGFRERPKSSQQFFRAGRAKSWEGVLDAGMRRQIVRDHGAVMERMGYSDDGETIARDIESLTSA